MIILFYTVNVILKSIPYWQSYIHEVNFAHMCFLHSPSFLCIPVDLFQFFSLAEDIGGYEEVSVHVFDKYDSFYQRASS